MKKIRKSALIFCLLLLIQCLFAPFFANATGLASGPDAAVTTGCAGLDAERPLYGSNGILTYSAGAIVYETTSGTLLYGWNPDDEMYPSSLVKIMTALLALEQGELDRVVTVRQEVLDTLPRNAMSVNLADGEEVTLLQLLYCMMVGSGNDAAAVIADFVGGSIENFVDEMNFRADELGCTGTNFENPTGLHNARQVSTPRDMAKILAEALMHPTFVEIFGAASYEMEATNRHDARILRTTNYMLSSAVVNGYYDSRVTGGRTGVTNDNDRCFAATAQDGEYQYITVVMGATPVMAGDGYTVRRQGSFEDTDTLLDLVFRRQTMVQILYAGQILAQYPVSGGVNDVALGVNTDVRVMIPAEYTDDELTIRVSLITDSLAAPVAQGQSVAMVTVWYRDVCVAQAEVFALNRSDAVIAPEETSPPDMNFGWIDAGALSTAFIVLGVIFLCILGLIGFVFAVRVMRRAIRRSRSRRRRQDRRRSK